MARTFVRASSQYLENAVSSPIGTGPSVFTLVAWYKPSSIANGTVLSAGGVSGVNYAAVGMNASGQAFMEVANGTDANAASGTLTNGVWGHIAGVQASATSRKSFLNGVAGTSETTSMTPSSLTTVTVGALSTGSLGRLSFAGGDIGECAMWNIALTDPQVASLAAGALPSTIPTGLVGYWKVTGTDSPELDSSGGARDLTVTGATAASGGDPPIGGGPTFLILPPPIALGPSYAARRAASI